MNDLQGKVVAGPRDQGLITRRRSAEDRRVVIVSATAEARGLYDQTNFLPSVAEIPAVERVCPRRLGFEPTAHRVGFA